MLWRLSRKTGKGTRDRIDGANPSQAIVDAAEDLAGAVKAVVFLGCPHRGVILARWGSRIARALNLFGLKANDRIFSELEGDSPHLRDLHKRFVRVADKQRIKVVNFFEQRESRVAWFNTLVRNTGNVQSDEGDGTDHRKVSARSLCKL